MRICGRTPRARVGRFVVGLSGNEWSSRVGEYARATRLCAEECGDGGEHMNCPNGPRRRLKGALRDMEPKHGSDMALVMGGSQGGS